jgi:hypothetical protein
LIGGNRNGRYRENQNLIGPDLTAKKQKSFHIRGDILKGLLLRRLSDEDNVEIEIARKRGISIPHQAPVGEEYNLCKEKNTGTSATTAGN